MRHSTPFFYPICSLKGPSQTLVNVASAVPVGFWTRTDAGGFAWWPERSGPLAFIQCMFERTAARPLVCLPRLGMPRGLQCRACRARLQGSRQPGLAPLADPLEAMTRPPQPLWRICHL